MAKPDNTNENSWYEVNRDFAPKNFDSPEKLPTSSDDAKKWQQANRTWWEQNPMRYHWKEKVPAEQGSKEFFDEIDRRFFNDAKCGIPSKAIPFDSLIPFDDLKKQVVLEIGVGSGSHAGLIAPRALSYTGIDLTDYAVKMTTSRMKLLGLTSVIKRMDAEKMEFPDNSFDFVWSWGVIHHSSNTSQVLNEIHRVLRPGGKAVIMVYYRGWWNYYVFGVLWGIFRGDLFRTRSLSRSTQEHTDGAFARYYSKSSWVALASRQFSVSNVSVSGNKADLFPLPAGSIKNLMMKFTPNVIVSFMLRKFNMGSFVISNLRKDP